MNERTTDTFFSRLPKPGFDKASAVSALTVLIYISFSSLSFGASYGDFSNELSKGANSSQAVTFYSGHVNYTNPPSNASFRLVESSYGQMVARTVPYASYVDGLYNDAYTVLYNKGDASAFIYKDKVFSADANIYNATETVADWWTSGRQIIAQNAINEIKKALQYEPGNAKLRELLLDACYDYSLAEMTLATEIMVDVRKARFGLEMGSQGIPIDGEIALLEQVYAQYVSALSTYFNLLKDNMGVDMGLLVDKGSPFSDVTFGYYMFVSDVPERSTNSGLSGFKDYALVWQIEKYAAEAAAELAKLYTLRNTDGDKDEALRVIRESQQSLYTDAMVLNGLFEEDVDCVAQAVAGHSNAMTTLSGLKTALDNGANPLGLDNEMLVLIQNENIAEQNYYDTYDILKTTLETGELANAMNDYLDAISDYKVDMNNQDDVARQLENLRSQFGDRLRNIAGVEVTDDNYDTPEDNEGSELWNSARNVDMAQLRIEEVQTRIENTKDLIYAEIEAVEKRHDINGLINELILEYSGKQQELTKEIAEINAKQAIANAAAQASSHFGGLKLDLGMFATSAHVANGAIQRHYEIAKGEKQAEKERLAAEENVEIRKLNEDLGEIDSELRIVALNKELITLSIELMQTVMVLAQSEGQRVALYDEKAYLEKRLVEARADLAERYYADPSHRLLYNQALTRADLSFSRTQVLVYMLARSLEYKWVTSVDFTYNETHYTPQTVFALRNAQELADMVGALDYFNTMKIPTVNRGALAFEMSLKRHVLGIEDAPDSLALFRETMLGFPLKEDAGNSTNWIGPSDFKAMQDSYSQVIHIEFSTNRNIDTFFSSLRWNEKIHYLTVLIDATTTASSTETDVLLAQGGTAYIRMKDSDAIHDFPIRNYNQETGAIKDYFGFGVISSIGGIDLSNPPENYQCKYFHELSPAVSQWVMEIPLKKKDGSDVFQFDSLKDVVIKFQNYFNASGQ